MEATRDPSGVIFGIMLLLAFVSFGFSYLKRMADKEEKDEVERQAQEVELRSQEILRLQRESREALQRLEARRIGDYLVAEPSLAEIDFFISHASEDKESFVRSLAQELRSLGAKVFYDEFTLKVGDSLRRSIDRGLGASKFGVVVLSDSFFKKEWPARELDGLVAREAAGRTRILPIWHKVSKDDVLAYSPTLADKVALNTSTKSVKEIASDLYALV